MATSATVLDHPSTARRDPWFFVLWIVWAVLLAGAMLWGNYDRHGSGFATFMRMGSSVVLCVVAWRAWALWKGLAVGPYAFWTALGITLGTIGDFFNAGLLDMVPVLHGTLGGMVAFGLGHIAYITGFFDFRKQAGLTDKKPMWIAVAAWQVFGVISWYFAVYQGEKHRELMWPALGYTLLLAGTAGIATGLALQQRRMTLLAVGGALFLASDLILAVGMFRESFPHSTEAVWLTYSPGQMLIVFALLTAAALLRDGPRSVAS